MIAPIGDFNDDPSGWLTRRRPFKIESEQYCLRNQRHNKAILRDGTLLHRLLARKLQTCTAADPCNCEACLLCMRTFRWRLLNQSISQIHFGDWTAASIVTAGAQFPIGDLASFDTRKHIRRWHKRIERNPLLSACRILGGIDISLNVDQGQAAYWQPHLYVLIAAEPSNALKQAVRSAFPAEPMAKRPHRFRSVVDQLEAISYSYKSHFYARHSYVNEEDEETIDRLPLPDDPHRELLLFLSRHSLGDRLLLRKFRRHGPGLNLLHLP